MGIEDGGGSAEGYEAFERTQDIRRVENMVSPETRAAIIEEISLLLYKIIEIGPAMDPQTVKQWRAQLRIAIGKLGIDIDKPQWGILYLDQVWQSLEESQFPDKPEGYPDFASFQEKVEQWLSVHEQVFGDLRGREGKELAEYLYGLGFVMSSRQSYRYIFPDTDPIVVNKRTGEIEGRHRYLTLAVLEELGFDTRQWYWVHIQSSS